MSASGRICVRIGGACLCYWSQVSTWTDDWLWTGEECRYIHMFYFLRFKLFFPEVYYICALDNAYYVRRCVC